MKKLILLIIPFLFLYGRATSQLDFNLSTSAIVSNSELVPLWLYSNQFGRYNSFGKGQLQTAPSLFFHHKKDSGITIDAGIETIIKNKLNETFIHQAFLNFHYKAFSLRIGQEAFSPYIKKGGLESGIFLLGTNARPFPKIGFGFYQFVPVGFTNGWIEFKAAITHGILIDKRGEYGTKNPLAHEKFAYLKSGNLPVNLYAGFTHFVLFGGTYFNGTKIPVDWPSAFFATESKKVGGLFPVEVENVAGDHIGMLDFGVEKYFNKTKVTISVQKPFEDYSGLRFFSQNKDLFLHFDLKKLPWSWMRNVHYEYIKTDWQSGIVSTGGDNYYNNGVYRAGYTNYGNTMGTPLFTTLEKIQKFAPKITGSTVYNNRIKGHHLGLSGEILPLFSYRILGTSTINFGNINPYTLNYHNNSNHFFYNGIRQNYFLFELKKTWPGLPLSVKTAFAFDWGEMYSASAFLLGISYQFRLIK